MVQVLLRKRALKVRKGYDEFQKIFCKNVKSIIVAILKDGTQLLIS